MTDNVISFIQNDPDDCMHQMAFNYIDEIMFEFFPYQMMKNVRKIISVEEYFIIKVFMTTLIEPINL